MVPLEGQVVLFGTLGVGIAARTETIDRYLANMMEAEGENGFLD
jgi:hypothetical protein